jgi:Leucine-rich repeat (LRR) protein
MTPSELDCTQSDAACILQPQCDPNALQGMLLETNPDTSAYPHNGRLPDLRPLTRLTCLCLADNRLQSMPPLATLQQLRCLDLSGNARLQVRA